MLIDVLAGLSFGIWAYLIAARGGFWLGAVRDDVAAVAPAASLAAWPAVAVVIPARNEADVNRQKRRLAADAGLPGAAQRDRGR